MQFGPLTLPGLEGQYAFALQCTMETYSLKSDFVEKRVQNMILNTLHIHSASNIKEYLRNYPEYYNPEVDSEKKWPFWQSQNDSLRKIVHGTYRGNTLPLPFVNAIRRIQDDKYRSFFVQRCIVYHNALYARSPEQRMNQKGVVETEDNFPAFKEEDFDRIDVTIPVDRRMPHDTTPARHVQQELVAAPASESSSASVPDPEPVPARGADSAEPAPPPPSDGTGRARRKVSAQGGGTSSIGVAKVARVRVIEPSPPAAVPDANKSSKRGRAASTKTN
jgi:hypothetical protein